MTDMKERVAQAIARGVQARSRYYQSIELEDEHALGEPVPEDLIIRLEGKVGKPLPPSFRAFLQLHNGWREVDGGVDLLPVETLLGLQDDVGIARWQRTQQQEGDAVAARSLVIGASRITPTKYLLDPGAADDNGEWPLLQYHDKLEAELPSFIQWLEESVDEYLELAQMEQDDE